MSTKFSNEMTLSHIAMTKVFFFDWPSYMYKSFTILNLKTVVNHGIFLFCRYSIILYNDPTWLTSILCILAVGALLLCDDPLSGKYGTYSFFVNTWCLNVYLLLIRYAVNQFSYVWANNFARSKFIILIGSH